MHPLVGPTWHAWTRHGDNNVVAARLPRSLARAETAKAAVVTAGGIYGRRALESVTGCGKTRRACGQTKLTPQSLEHKRLTSLDGNRSGSRPGKGSLVACSANIGMEFLPWKRTVHPPYLVNFQSHGIVNYFQDIFTTRSIQFNSPILNLFFKKINNTVTFCINMGHNA